MSAVEGSLGQGEQEQLSAALEERFVAPLEEAAAAVRTAERELEDAQERLARAEEAAQARPYRSDPLVFMRDGLSEELAGLDRKTNPKKVRVAYRFLLDRAVELATAEVRGFHDDLSADEEERVSGMTACREAVQRATDTLEAARLTVTRVQTAQRAARDGLAIAVEKLSTPFTD